MTKEEIELSIDICAQIKRTLLSYRLYGETHEQAGHHEGTTFQKIKAFTDEHGSLNLEVTSDALCVGPRRVMQDDESGQEPIVACLFADGIKRVTIDEGVSTVEVSRLLRQWSTAIRGRFATDYSLSSALWEDDLEHVSLTTIEAIGERGANDEVDSLAVRIDDIVRGLQGEECASPLRVAPSALWVLARHSGLSKLAPADLKARAEAERLPSLSVSSADIAHVTSALQAARRGAAPRTLLAAFRALRAAEPAESQELLKVVRGMVVDLLEGGRHEEVKKMCLRVIEIATEEPARRLDVEAFMACFGDPRAAHLLTRELDDRNRRPAALGLLQYLPRRELPALFGALLLPATPEGRTALVDLIARKRPTQEQIEVAFDNDGDAGPELFRVARRLGPELANAMLQRALLDRRPGVTLAVLNRVKTAEVPVFRGLLLEMSKHSDLDVKNTAVTLLARARDPLAVELLRHTVANADLPLGARRAAIAGLAAITDDDARAVLRSLFTSETVFELKAALALALGQTRDLVARPLLQAEARKLFGHRSLKEACKQALRRLESEEP